MTESQSPERLRIRLVKATGSALVINLAIYYIARPFDAFPDSVLTAQGSPITVVPVIIATLAGLVAGALVYALIRRFKDRPDQTFIPLALAALALSFLSPFSITNAPSSMIVSLLLMHLVAGSSAIYWMGLREPKRLSK